MDDDKYKKNKTVLYIEINESIEDSILLSHVMAAKLECLNIVRTVEIIKPISL